jgi:hypothetical protein
VLTRAAWEDGGVSDKAGRYQRSAAGMIGAMVVLLAVVTAFVLLRDANRVEQVTPVREVDYQRTLDFGRDQLDFPVLAPQRLPDGWRATSVDLVPDPPRWHLGLLTDKGRYVGLEQSRSPVDTMVDKHVDPRAVRGGVVEIEGETWRTWTDEGGDNALTRVEDGVTTLVVGTAGQDVLADFVRNLG